MGIQTPATDWNEGVGQRVGRLHWQLREQINSALVSLSDHFSQIYQLIDGPAPPPPPILLEELLSIWTRDDVMQAERDDHLPALEGETTVRPDPVAEALARLRAGPPPDLILTDIVMPGVDGLQLIAQARQLLRFTPIVALTTQSQQHLRDKGRAAGATAWLLKPTGGQELVALVQQFLQAQQATGHPVG